MVIIALAFYLLGNQGDRFNWFENYKMDSVEPYGTYALTELLDAYATEDTLNLLTDTIPQSFGDSLLSTTYVFVGKSVRFSQEEEDRILSYVERGNTAFISSNNCPDLVEWMSNDDCTNRPYYRSFGADTAHLDFNLPSLAMDETGFPLSFKRYGQKMNYAYSYFSKNIFCYDQVNYEALGTVDTTKTNFAKFKYGEGTLYLHATPLAFTNYHITTAPGKAYADRIFSHLPKQPIYYDVRKGKSLFADRTGGGSGGFSKDGQLQYILSKPSLRAAWYLMLAMAALYMIFRAKRKQRVIPVLEPNNNTSLEFITTVGRLYFIQNRHQKLAVQKSKLFLSYVKEKYNLSIRELDDKFIKQLVGKSEVPEKAIKDILTMSQNIERSQSLTETGLIEFHQRLDYFYKNCK